MKRAQALREVSQCFLQSHPSVIVDCACNARQQVFDYESHDSTVARCAAVTVGARDVTAERLQTMLPSRIQNNNNNNM